MSKFYANRRWLNINPIPIYYQDDGSVDIELTIRDLLLVHELAERHQPELLSAVSKCLVYEDSDED